MTTEDGASDPFDATGGVVCEQGVVGNAGGHFVGWQSTTHAQILILKRFTCDDRTFDILLRVKLDFETSDTVATWSVVDGTGAYESLRGSGTLIGTNNGGETILDEYVGGMHINTSLGFPPESIRRSRASRMESRANGRSSKR